MSALHLELPPDITAEEAAVSLAVRLWEDGRLSLGQAAELAGHSKRAFIEILGKKGLSIFNYDPDDLEREIKL